MATTWDLPPPPHVHLAPPPPVLYLISVQLKMMKINIPSILLGAHRSVRKKCSHLMGNRRKLVCLEEREEIFSLYKSVLAFMVPQDSLFSVMSVI